MGWNDSRITEPVVTMEWVKAAPVVIVMIEMRKWATRISRCSQLAKSSSSSFSSCSRSPILLLWPPLPFSTRPSSTRVFLIRLTATMTSPSTGGLILFVCQRSKRCRPLWDQDTHYLLSRLFNILTKRKCAIVHCFARFTFYFPSSSGPLPPPPHPHPRGGRFHHNSLHYTAVFPSFLLSFTHPFIHSFNLSIIHDNSHNIFTFAHADRPPAGKMILNHLWNPAISRPSNWAPDGWVHSLNLKVWCE